MRCGGELLCKIIQVFTLLPESKQRQSGCSDQQCRSDDQFINTVEKQMHMLFSSCLSNNFLS